VHQDIDLDTDQGWMLAVLTGMMDEMHSRNVAKDTLRSMKSAAADGFFVGGRVPFGYKAVAAGKRRRLEPHEINANIVRSMFRLALEEGLGSQAIALRLNADGLLRDGKRWGKTSVDYILCNQAYMGVRLFNQTNAKFREAKPEEQVIQVPSHPALVSKEDFERVRIMMNQRTPHEHGGTPKSSFAFTGLLRCGVCEGQLQMVNGTGRGNKLYSYYGCLAHRAGKPRCLFKNVPAEAFDAWMLEEILNKVLTADVVQGVINDIRRNGDAWASERDLKRKAMVKELRGLEGRRNNLFDLMELHGKKTPNLEDVTARLRQLSKDIEAIQCGLGELEAKAVPNYNEVDIDPRDAAETIYALLKGCEDKKKIRALLGTFVEKITIDSQKAIVEYREEALLRSPAPTVHSGIRWLPVRGSLRTAHVVIMMPSTWPRLRAAA
jgi:hypothetical protein